MSTKKTERIFTKVHSIKEYLAVLEGHGDKTLYRWLEAREYKSNTYSEFVALIKSIAKGIEANSLSGKRIAVIGETSVEWVASYLAILASGGVVIPMDKELDTAAIEGFLETAEAEAIVYSKSFNAKFASLAENHPTVRLLIPMDGTVEANERILPLAKLIESGKDTEFEITERATTDLAVMLFTSGTTGTSKCVMLCEKNIWSTVNAACETVEFYKEDTIVSVLPLHHTYELACMLSGLNYGMTVGINDSLKNIMKNFAEYKPTGLILVPLFVNTMYNRIIDKAKKSGRYGKMKFAIKLSNFLRVFRIDRRRKFFGEVLNAFGGNLTKIVSGGAPLNPEMMKAFESFGVTISEGYGITECSPLISVNPYYALKSGSVGPAVPSCTVRIAGENKNDKGFTEGEIQVKGDNVMLGYYNNPEENEKAFTEDGWYRTGDVGYMDKDGYIYITGRLKSVIVLENGKNVFPEEMEEYLEKFEEVGEVVVVGRKAEDGETVKLTAIVYPKTDIYGETPDTERAYNDIHAKIIDLNRKLPSFKQIKTLEIRTEPFEKTTSRKIKRHLVK
jgi:long-chain acyl-CoA synthetase